MLDQDGGLPTALVDFPAMDGTRQRLSFSAPLQWLVAHAPLQVPALLDAAHALAREGRWCIGWVAYEAAPGLDPHLPVKALPPGRPYAVWAVFDQAEPWPAWALTPPPAAAPTPTLAAMAVEAAASPTWQAGPWAPDFTPDIAARRIEEIRELIRAGEVYQVNLTTRLDGGFAPGAASPTAAALAYFDALRRGQPQSYALMLDGRAAARSPGLLLSVSPELFFDWDGAAVTTRPMKGTAQRGATRQEDEQARAHLASSAKERAENLMIVDLLRNDLSRIAEVGSVQVPALFELQALPTVWQMTSTVTARTRQGLRLSELFAALFPCGSVTGAPKQRAMHHIARLEASPRGAYCGAAGVMAPGGRVTLNVPIRTVTIDTPPPPAPWTARCGIGSGITLDATPAGEAAEWRAKRAFLHRADRPFDLLESLRLQDGHIPRLALHLARLARSAGHFGHAWDAQASPALVRQVLQSLADENPVGRHKLRLRWTATGQVLAEVQPLAGPDGTNGPDDGGGVPSHASANANADATSRDMNRIGRAPDAELPQVILAAHPLPGAATDEFVRHKTTARQCYAPFAPAQGMLDTLLYNEAGELTEFTIGNLALQLDGRWYTPPARCGLLPGVMREDLLSRGVLTERVLRQEDLAQAQGIALINSVRGWLPVRCAAAGTPPPSLADS